MTSTKTVTTSDKPPKEKKNRTPAISLSAQDKAQAVLAVWTERCKPVDVCRQFNVNWITFNHWQRRAMEGMLQALESRVNLARGEALSPRLRLLLQRQQRQNNLSRLSGRLEQVQQNKIANSLSDPAKTG
jgi:transposase-like protein